MPRCSFFTGKFTQCTHNADQVYCGQHAPKAQRIIARVGALPVGACPCVVGTPAHWCGRALQEGHPICESHVQRIQRQTDREAARQTLRLTVAELVEAYMLEEPRPTWRTVTDLVIARMMLPHTDPMFLQEMTALNVARRFYLLTARPEEMGPHDFRDHWFGMPPPVALPPPVAGLGQLAEDVQNVHTAVVATQTNTNVDLLLAEDSCEGQNTLGWMTQWWMRQDNVNPSFDSYWQVMEDIRHWYGKRTCKSTNDRLYKRVLDGLVHKILMATVDKTDLFVELTKRLWEECSEAVGMCCEGHISRLANVFVGFDETFKSPASPNEMLQTRLAEIAQLKLRPETKLAKAKDVMDELGIPEAERAPWLEALEE